MITARNSIRVEITHSERLAEIRTFHEFSKENERRHLLGVLAFEQRAIIYTNPFILDFVPVSEYLKDTNRLSPDQVSTILVSVLEALRSLNTLSHGCIRCDNIFVREDLENMFVLLGSFSSTHASKQNDLLCVANVACELGDYRSAQTILDFTRSHGESPYELTTLIDKLDLPPLTTPSLPTPEICGLLDELTKFTTVPQSCQIPTPPEHNVVLHAPENLEKSISSSQKKDSIFSAALTYVWSRFS